MTTQQDSVDVERLLELFASMPVDADYANAEQFRQAVNKWWDDGYTALSLPITQRDEQGERTYADAVEDAARVADQEADDIEQLPHHANDSWQRGRAAMARTIATAIRRLSIKQNGGAPLVSQHKAPNDHE